MHSVWMSQAAGVLALGLFGAEAVAAPREGPRPQAIARDAARLSAALDTVGPFDPAWLDARPALEALRIRLNGIAAAARPSSLDFEPIVAPEDLSPRVPLAALDLGAAPEITVVEPRVSTVRAPATPAQPGAPGVALDFGAFESEALARVLWAEAEAVSPGATRGLSTHVRRRADGGVTLSAQGFTSAADAEARRVALARAGLSSRVVRIAGGEG